MPELDEKGLLGIERMENLVDLKIENCPYIRDVRFLRGCKSLRTLSLRGTSLVSTTGIGDIATLTELDVSRCLLLKSRVRTWYRGTLGFRCRDRVARFVSKSPQAAYTGFGRVQL